MANHLYYGDNLEIMRKHIAAESVDLIYLDPPFNSKATYNVLFRAPTGQQSQAQNLHCDPTASHYLKVLLDALSGPANFRNEISWRRSNPKSHGKINSRTAGTSFSLHKKDAFTFNRVFGEHDPAYVEKAYKYIDENGRSYRLLPFLNPNGNRPNLTDESRGFNRVWRWTKDRMQKKRMNLGSLDNLSLVRCPI